MARRNKPDAFEDDGRTIVPMNVDGMPWYTRGVEDTEQKNTQQPGVTQRAPLSKQEARGYAWAAAKAGLLIGAVFAAAFFGFLAFCYFVWFR